MSEIRPPPSILEKARSELETLRGIAGDNSELVDHLAIEILLCGRIWSEGTREELLPIAPSLCHEKGRIHTTLRACLTYHQLEKLDAYDWENLSSLRRNEELSNMTFKKASNKKVPSPDDIMERLEEITEAEHETLGELDITLLDAKVLDDEESVLQADPDEDFWDVHERDLFHISYDSVKSVIDSNVEEESIDNTGYFSLTISEIFQETLRDFIANPCSKEYEDLEGTNKSFGILYLVDQHSLITAPVPFEEENFLRELERRLKITATDRGMKISGLRLRCSNAREVIEKDSEEWVTEVKIDSHEFEIDKQILDEKIKELLDQKNRLIKGWGGNLAKDRLGRVMYIDAVHLSNQIWGPVGDRKSIDAFMRSIRITPYMDMVFGKAQGSVNKCFTILHGGDDFLLSFDEHSKGREDLVTILMSTDLGDLLGTGRWYKADESDTMRVIGTGFALPFWWWSETNMPSGDKVDYLEQMKEAKNDRRNEWLSKATRIEVQIHPDLE